MLGIVQRVCIKNRRGSYNGNQVNSSRKNGFSELAFQEKQDGITSPSPSPLFRRERKRRKIPGRYKTCAYGDKPGNLDILISKRLFFMDDSLQNRTSFVFQTLSIGFLSGFNRRIWLVFLSAITNQRGGIIECSTPRTLP